MIPYLTLPQILALAVVIVGAVHDLVNSKIPNWLTFGAAALGIALHSFQNGLLGGLWSILGWLTGAGISLMVKMLPVVLRRYRKIPIGFGDTKLIAAVGCFLGPVSAVLTYYYFCLWYGVLALIQFLKIVPWSNLGWLIGSSKSISPTLWIDKERLAKVAKSPIPIGVAIAAGTLCAILLERATLEYCGLSQLLDSL